MGMTVAPKAVRKRFRVEPRSILSLVPPEDEFPEIRAPAPFSPSTRDRPAAAAGLPTVAAASSSSVRPRIAPPPALALPRLDLVPRDWAIRDATRLYLTDLGLARTVAAAWDRCSLAWLAFEFPRPAQPQPQPRPGELSAALGDGLRRLRAGVQGTLLVHAPAGRFAFEAACGGNLAAFPARDVAAAAAAAAAAGDSAAQAESAAETVARLLVAGDVGRLCASFPFAGAVCAAAVVSLVEQGELAAETALLAGGAAAGAAALTAATVRVDGPLLPAAYRELLAALAAAEPTDARAPWRLVSIARARSIAADNGAAVPLPCRVIVDRLPNCEGFVQRFVVG